MRAYWRQARRIQEGEPISALIGLSELTRKFPDLPDVVSSFSFSVAHISAATVTNPKISPAPKGLHKRALASPPATASSNYRPNRATASGAAA